MSWPLAHCAGMGTRSESGQWRATLGRAGLTYLPNTSSLHRRRHRRSPSRVALDYTMISALRAKGAALVNQAVAQVSGLMAEGGAGQACGAAFSGGEACRLLARARAAGARTKLAFSESAPARQVAKSLERAVCKEGLFVL